MRRLFAFYILFSFSMLETEGEGPPYILWKQQMHSDRVNSVAFSPDGQFLASGSSDRLIHFFQISDGSLVRTLNEAAEPVHENSVESIAFSPDGKWLAAAGYRKVDIWNLVSGTLAQTLTNQADWVLSIGYSPDGQYLATGSFDTTILLWNTTNWTVRQTFHHDGQVRCVAYSPDGLHLVTGAGDSDVRIWHVPDGPLHHIWSGHTADVESVAVSPNALTVASGSEDTTIKLWNISNNQLLRTLTGHTWFVYAIAFSPDGQTLASCAGLDNTIKLWRVSDGALLQNFTEETTEVNTVKFSRNGLLGYGRTDGTVVLASVNRLLLRPNVIVGKDFQFTVSGLPGESFVIQTSTNFSEWKNRATNTLSTSSENFSIPIQSAGEFVRVQQN